MSNCARFAQVRLNDHFTLTLQNTNVTIFINFNLATLSQKFSTHWFRLSKKRNNPKPNLMVNFYSILRSIITLKNLIYNFQTLMDSGYELVSGGTENHLVLVNLKPKGIDGSRVEKVMEAVHIAANKNTVPGDVSAMVPGGIRMGEGYFSNFMLYHSM